MNFLVSSVWARCGLLASALLCVHCGSSDSAAGGSSGTAGAPEGGGASAFGGASGDTAGAGRDSSGSSGSSSANVGGAAPTTPGSPNCGFGDGAAFCDTFDAPGASHGRAGELDSSKWSGARIQPQFPSAVNGAIGITGATIPHCRAGISDNVFPDGDTLICDPNDAIASNYLLVAVGAQNYGQNSYRVRQPFDYAGRTGKIVFDADGSNSPLLGWISVEVTEDPIPGPGFDTGPGNDEGNQLPKNAFEVQFQNECAGVSTVPSVGVRFVAVYNDYKGTFLMPSDYVCVKTKPGFLNHFEVTVSNSKIEVFGSDYSEDGKAFPTPRLMHSVSVNLPFSRGYVNFTTHNHATLKYSQQAIDAWVVPWDNTGFDGPVISESREYEIPDSLIPGMNPQMKPITNIGYLVADAANEPRSKQTFKGVDLAGISKARLALSGYYLFNDGRDLAATEKYTLKFRFNGGAWHDRPLSTAEASIINGSSQGQVAQMIDVPLADLIAGDNTLEFVTSNVPQNYPPVVSNIELILDR